MTNYRIHQIQDEIAEWTSKNFPNTPPHRPLLGAMEELGELCHAHLKGEQNIRGMDNQEKTIALKQDAIGDILIYLTHYCALNNWDLMWIFEDTWAEVKKRDWQKNPNTGTSAIVD